MKELSKEEMLEITNSCAEFVKKLQEKFNGQVRCFIMLEHETLTGMYNTKMLRSDLIGMVDTAKIRLQQLEVEDWITRRAAPKISEILVKSMFDDTPDGGRMN